MSLQNTSHTNQCKKCILKNSNNEYKTPFTLYDRLDICSPTLLFVNYLPDDKLQNTRLLKHTPASLFVAHTEISAYVYHLTKSFIIIHQVIHSVTISNSLSHHANRPEAGQTCAVQPTQFVPTTNDSRSKISAISPARQFIRNKPWQITLTASLYDQVVLHSNFKTGNTLIFIHNIE